MSGIKGLGVVYAARNPLLSSHVCVHPSTMERYISGKQVPPQSQLMARRPGRSLGRTEDGGSYSTTMSMCILMPAQYHLINPSYRWAALASLHMIVVHIQAMSLATPFPLDFEYVRNRREKPSYAPRSWYVTAF